MKLHWFDLLVMDSVTRSLIYEVPVGTGVVDELGRREEEFEPLKVYRNPKHRFSGWDGVTWTISRTIENAH